MKTTRKYTFLKVISMAALALTLVSCGKDNKSGGSSSSLIGSLGLNASASQYINTVVQQQSQACQSNGRQMRQFSLPVPVNGYGTAVGITSNYSAAILNANGNQNGTLLLYLCDDPSNPFIGQQPQIINPGMLEQTDCPSLFNIRGLQIAIAVQGTQMTGQPFYFVFRPTFQQTIQCSNGLPFGGGF